MLPLYSLALAAALALGSPVWLWRMLRHGRYRGGLPQRLGRLPAPLLALVQSARRDGRGVLWLHAVSVGEVVAAAPLVAALESRTGHLVVVSTTTPAGQSVARERFGAERVFFYPLDFAFAVRRVLSLLQPAALILMESELWPRMLEECSRRGIPVVVANARVSDRSLPRYLRLRRLWRPLLERVTLLLAQSPQDAERWQRIGAPAERVLTTGNLKYDAPPASPTPLSLALEQFLPAGAPLLVCGSTHPGEEELLLACWPQLLAEKPSALLLLAPRHPQRAAAVLHLAARALRWPAVSLRRWRTNPAPFSPGSVLVLDTIGDLAAVYAVATAAFIGGSLVPRGGHNPLEAAAHGVPVVTGPHFENFRDMVSRMHRQNAIAVTQRDSLCATLLHLLTAPGELGAAGRDFAVTERGATARSVDSIAALLQPNARQR